MNKGIIALAFGGFAIGMTEFSMMGMLPDIASDLNISIPNAAHLIALYALGVVVGAPLLVLITGKYPPKRVLLILMSAFFIFNFLFAISPNYFLLELTRFAAGLPHGAFFGVGTVVATRLAKQGREARAIAVIFTGMTIANLAGVPLGTYIGHHFSWRITYVAISFVGLITLLLLFLLMPDLPQQEGNNLLGQVKYFKRKRSWLLIAVISIGTGGLFAWISYIAPLVTEVSGIDAEKVPIIMALVGLGMVVGNLLGGRIADAVSPTKATIICFSAMALCLVFVNITAAFEVMAYVMAFITGLISFTAGTPIQMMLIKDAKGAETFAAATGQACFNIGNTLGALLGGLPVILGFSYASPVLVGALLASIGCGLTLVYYFSRKKEVAL